MIDFAKKINMKKNRTLFLLTFFLITLIASACSSVPSGGWPGMSLGNDKVFVAYSSFVYGINKNDGSLAWKYPAEADKAINYYASPILSPDGKQLIVGDYTKTLYSLNPVDGSLNWTYIGTSRWIAPVLATTERIYAPSSDQKLYAIDYSGNKVWTFSTKGAIWSQPVTNGKLIFLGSMDHYLYAIQSSDGKEVWKTDLGASTVSTPLLSDDGILYLGTIGDELLAIKASDGTILWRVSTDAGIWSTPVLEKNTLYIGDLSGVLYSISAENGKILWTHATSSLIIGNPVITEKGIVFGDETGTLTAIDFNNSSLWSKTFNGKLYPSPIVESDRIYVAISSSSDNLLVALDTSGNQVWAFEPAK
jgi:eukaryotic-like serine/threonine-protein kinase